MRRVILESPYSASNGYDVSHNEAYAEACILDCLKRGESPIASHLLFTRSGILNDLQPEERKLGMAAGHAWYCGAQACVLYADYGISDGMVEGVKAAAEAGVPTEIRYLGITSSAATISPSSIKFSKLKLVRMSDS